MADSITTTATLKAEGLELDDTIDGLLDADEFTTDPLKPHKAAWAQVKRDLLARQPPIAESDLSDTSELTYPTHLCVLYKLFNVSEVDSDKVATGKYWREYRKALKEVRITVSGTEQVSGTPETKLVRA
jgi:hypothetical protein